MGAGLCTLTVNSWSGDLPLPGQYVMAKRGRTAFRVIGVKLPSANARYRCKLICERERRESVRDDAIVWRWEWAKR